MEWRYLLKELFADRTRVLLTIFAIAWGTLAIVLMLAVGQGLLSTMTGLMEQMGSNLVILQGGSTSQPYQGQSANTPVTFDATDIASIGKLPGVQLAIGEYTTYIDLSYQAKQTNSMLSGVENHYLSLHEVTLQPGSRFINPDDIAKHRAVIVLGHDIANALFPDMANPVGKQITLGPFYFTVIGVTADYNQIFSYENPDSYLTWIPATTFHDLLPQQNYTYILAKTQQSDAAQALQPIIRQTIARHHQLDPSDQAAFNFTSNQDNVDSIAGFFHGLELFLGIIGGVTLLVASLGIANIMYIAVQRAIPAIGIRMACGAQALDIARHYLLQALVATFLGGALGMVIAGSIIYIANLILPSLTLFGLKGLHLSLSWPLFSIIISTLSAVGLAAGIFPALKAAHIQPVEALRHE